MFLIKEITDPEHKARITRDVLHDLPEWFGLPESTQNYISESKDLQTWAAFDQDEAIAFISIQETSTVTVDIHCMGVKKVFHRKGVGQQLFQTVLDSIRDKYHLIQVKTVAKGNYPEYDQTNAFYDKMGFLDLEIFPEMWDPWNPCLIKVRPI